MTPLLKRIIEAEREARRLNNEPLQALLKDSREFVEQALDFYQTIAEIQVKTALDRFHQVGQEGKEGERPVRPE